MAEQDAITEHLDTILQTNEQMVPKMPESVFQHHLLPALVGESREHRMDIWLEAAGSWQRPIDVVDDQTGEYLFRVPSLVGDISIKRQRAGQDSAFEIIMEARRRMQTITAKAGYEFLRENLRKRIGEAGQHDKALAQWNYIFKRYGYDHLVYDPYGQITDQSQTDTQPAQQTQSKSKDKPSVEGYDEL